MFKFSYITLIFKSDSLSIVLNYRLISIQSHITKIFKSLVPNGIQRPVTNILMMEQHSFRPGHFTTTCNLVFKSFQQWSHIDIVYMHFNKAFDPVSDKIKLQFFMIMVLCFFFLCGAL